MAASNNDTLEFRAGCSASEGLLQSDAFRRCFEIYRRYALEMLSDKTDPRTSARTDFISKINTESFLALYRGEIDDDKQAKKIHNLTEDFFDFYRNPESYSRLVRIMDPVGLTEKSHDERQSYLGHLIGRQSLKSSSLHNVIQQTRRELAQRVGIAENLFRDLDSTTKIQILAVPGHFMKNLPTSLSRLGSLKVTISAEVQTGIDYRTPKNKRTEPFVRLQESSLGLDQLQADDWIAMPLNVGGSLILACIHKSKGNREMEPGMLNLFPLAEIDEIENRKPDALFFFGAPDTTKDDFGFARDEVSDTLIGIVPSDPEFQYFGYVKKPVLTLANTLAIEKGELPLHCACERYTVRFDSDGKPYIDDINVKADDMGSVRMEEDASGETRILFRGTETGAFACLDGFSGDTRKHMEGREVGYNKGSNDNARVIVPVTTAEEVQRDDELDYLFYVNNYDLKAEHESTIEEKNVDKFIDIIRKGERVAAGSTGTRRGGREISYWANPFPLLVDTDGKVLDSELYEKFSETEARFIGVAKNLVEKGDLIVGVAYSQMMVGAGSELSDLRPYCEPDFAKGKEVSDLSEEELKTWRKQAEERFEMGGPARHSNDLEKKIFEIALKKYQKIFDTTGEYPAEVDVTGARVGDSRTGKSETIAAICSRLNIPLVS